MVTFGQINFGNEILHYNFSLKSTEFSPDITAPLAGKRGR